jgi:hypothetical protein
MITERTNERNWKGIKEKGGREGNEMKGEG